MILTDRVFAHAVNIVKRIPRTGSPRPSYADRFKLYGLYKQSMEGDVPTSFQRPPDDAPDTEEVRADKAKWYCRLSLSFLRDQLSDPSQQRRNLQS